MCTSSAYISEENKLLAERTVASTTEFLDSIHLHNSKRTLAFQLSLKVHEPRNNTLDDLPIIIDWTGI